MEKAAFSTPRTGGGFFLKRDSESRRPCAYKLAPMKSPETKEASSRLQHSDHPMKAKEIKRSVREGYKKVARNGAACCGPRTKVSATSGLADSLSEKVGYSKDELKSVPEGANLVLGCGNPIALGSLKPGETVLDLGSGAGLDCFLAAQIVGESGKVIGLDMTPDMLEKAKVNAENGGYNNVEFRLGEIEELPVADGDVDVVISNCVISLSPDKSRVFKEAFRVLKPGGRMIISDIVISKSLPDCIKESVEAYVGCLSDAIMRDEYLKCIEGAGFQNLKVLGETRFPLDCLVNDPTVKGITEASTLPPEILEEVAKTIISLKIEAHRELH